MRLAAIIVLIAIGCSSDEELKRGFFMVKVNGGLFIPDVFGSGTFDNDTLFFSASSTYKNQSAGTISQIEITIWNPKEGVNSITTYKRNTILRVYQWTDNARQVRVPATSGEIYLSKADTINKLFSGTFWADVYYPSVEGVGPYFLREGRFVGLQIED